MLIGLTGRAQAGKDTVYERAAHVVAQSWADLDRVAPIVERRSFADTLYRSAAAALCVTEETLRIYKADPDVTIEVVHRDLGPLQILSTRQYLQAYGTEAHRDIFGSDFWVEHANLHNHHDRIVFVTDVRFDNEAHAVRDAGGIIVEVVGPDNGLGTDHPSEAGVHRDLVTVTIDNTTRDDDYATLDGAVRFLLDVAGVVFPCASA